MASKIKVDQIEGSTGSTITIPTGQTLTITDGIAASTIGSGTLASARLPTVPVSKGGTGLTSLGSAGQALKVASGGSTLEFGAISAGKVLPILSSIKTDTFSVTSQTFTDTGLQAQITPASTNNKILILCTGCGTQSAALGRTHLRIHGTTTQFVGDATSGFEASTTICSKSADAGWQQIPFTISGIDAPNSTSQQTYKLQICSSSSGTAKLNRPSNTPDANSGNTMSSIVLMELEDKMSIEKAILSINSDAKFSVNADDVNQITWLDGTTPIPVKDIQAKIDAMPTAEEELTAQENIRASAKAKLIAGEALTEEEADILIVK